jgi:hypothetical protein
MAPAVTTVPNLARSDLGSAAAGSPRTAFTAFIGVTSTDITPTSNVVDSLSAAIHTGSRLSG